jgi:RNA polymerase sigma factor (sigma-70 family)
MARSDVEAGLLSRAIKHDRQAFGELYVQYRPPVARYISFLVRNEHEADDLTSETFLRAWNAIGRYEDRGLPVEAWLIKIAHNVTISHLRRPRPIAVDDLVLPANPRHSPENVAEGLLEVDAVRRAILALPGVQRQVILLRFIENFSYEEVSEIVGKSTGAVRVIQHRALRTMRGLLGETLFPERFKSLERGVHRDRRPSHPSTYSVYLNTGF